VTIIAVAPTEAEDPERFLDLLEPHLPGAYRMAYAMLQSAHEAEDAVQEAVLRAWGARGRLRADSNPRPWFLTIVANQCRQLRRNRWWSVLKRSEMPEGVSDEPPAQDAATDLRLALARLPHRHRLVLVLRYYLDLPFDEIGRTLGISTVAAKARVHRALGRLRAEVPEDLNDA
jgi:RNA polymerase sigma-70 factor (ECF subfamily)